MKQIHVVGLGLCPQDLPSEISEIISRADVIVGGQRLLDHFKGHPGVSVPIKSPVKEVIEKIGNEAREDKDVVVLADGDPGFFGIGRVIVDAFGRENVIIHSNVTTLQSAASRLRIPWHDIVTVSLHGRRDILPLLRALSQCNRVGLFTGPDFGPSMVANELIKRGVNTFNMHVFEELGTLSEKTGYYELKDALKKDFSQLNFVLFQRVHPPEIRLHLGMDDELYMHERGIITKKEVRSTGISMLGLLPFHTLWDLGAGSGSVAIEASLLLGRGAVFAVEKNPDRACFIRRNIQKTGAYIVEVIDGKMPECLGPLPDPDRIFIGGGIGKENRVLSAAANRLKPGGKLVLHLVLIGSLSRAKEYFSSLKWPFSISHVQVSRSKDTAGDQRFDALNPVYIMSAEKPLETRTK
ncbi:MAG: precorrin-6y C5,15-methyltransferase (decarboxylating) subunit CbiE [Deltaproteobacteria bacterium]|nr:precorrin-6y C5,15-methyltransferase (decarboxylating) subunit CbiE [Deltaproteobacteria bacterium]